ncbi:uncharacterized protein [Penaeus vannamei]|uniref:uncharacterized protein n=1 Tax=Penaeus vannamei TaxID=6689 RepID=UPI00387F6C97
MDYDRPCGDGPSPDVSDSPLKYTNEFFKSFSGDLMEHQGTVYKTVLRPVLLYGAETWALRRKENLLERTEMRMVRWIAGISLRERRESADIRRMAGICSIREKAREARSRYFGHVKRGAEEGPVYHDINCEPNRKGEILEYYAPNVDPLMLVKVLMHGT